MHIAILFILTCYVFFLFSLDSGMYSSEKQGNCLRYFALQSVCSDAMRKAFDNLSGTFAGKISKFKQHCSKNVKKWGQLIKCNYCILCNYNL